MSFLEVIGYLFAGILATGAALIFRDWLNGTLFETEPEWHPMKDAPKDGTHIIGRFGDRAHLIFWGDGWRLVDMPFSKPMTPLGWRHHHRLGVFVA